VIALALADAVLVLHAAIVLFVVGGLAAVLLGNRLGWGWVNAPTFRFAHLAAIGVVVAQAWLGVVCPLTTLESALRARAGQSGYGSGFIAHWVGRLIYHDAPAWVFTALYTGFGSAVAAAWWRYPPRSGRAPGAGEHPR
jgi:hypothetical protein